MFVRLTGWLSIALVVLAWAGLAAAQTDFITFESGAVRPVALTPDGTRLLVANVPDGYLEVFDTNGGAEPIPVTTIPVGLEPVAVLAVDNDEVWVVNHLSDSVSIVSLAAGRVVRTLLVGDEPRDIVMADPPGPTGPRVFVTTAHRGQHRTDASIAAVAGAGDPQLTTAGVDRADVWVFDPAVLGATIGGTPLEIMTFFADTPRALAVSADGSHVYVAAHHSGNQTTTVGEAIVCDGLSGANQCQGDGTTSPGGLGGGQLPGGVPGPDDNHAGVETPEVGIIVKYDNASSEFRDELGRNWNNGVRFTLPDKDVFAIDVENLTEAAFHAHVGTTIFNMIVDPMTGKLYATNTESINHVRFEGAGTHGGTTVQGHLAEARITVIDTPNTTGSAVTPRHLNKHIDYSKLHTDVPDLVDPTQKNHSLATPLDMALHHDQGTTTLYVAAFGSSKVGTFDLSEIDADTFVPSSASHITVSGGGPAGLALTSDGSRLYVLTRFDNSISVIDTGAGTELHHVAIHNPEPTEVVTGRPFLYDAFNTSGNGEASCAACHVFGDMDQLAWDLGDPDGDVTSNPMPINFEPVFPFFSLLGLDVGPINGGAEPDEFHPMKGPMTTQTLKGLPHSGAMHWRGDRSNGFFGIDATDADLSFNNFIVAFEGLLGMDGTISAVEMQQFTDFALEMVLPPNPVRALDNSLTADEQAGSNFYFGPRRSDGATDLLAGVDEGFTCNECHELDASLGRFGTSTNATFENEVQIIKIAHLRNMYQKVGMFGNPDSDFIISGPDTTFQGDQIRGFGFLHDGSIDTMSRFFHAEVFNGLFDPGTGFTNPAVEIPQMEKFMLAFDSDLAPIVGQQITLTSTNGGVTNPRIDLLIQRADASFTSLILGGVVTECDLIAKGTVSGSPMGWVYTGGGVGSGTFDAADGTSTTDTVLRALSATTDLTFTCVPPGSGVRMGINRDRDMHLDANDNCPAFSNDAQTDTDMDGLGDECDPTPLPEPGQLAMLLSGIALLGRLERRRRQRRG